MDNKELIKKLINFDDGDTSTGFVAAAGHEKGFLDFLGDHKNIEIMKTPGRTKKHIDVAIVSDADVPYPDPDMEPGEKVTWIVGVGADDDETAYDDFVSETELFDPDTKTYWDANELGLGENTPEYENIRKHWDRIKEIMEEIVSSYGQ